MWRSIPPWGPPAGKKKSSRRRPESPGEPVQPQRHPAKETAGAGEDPAVRTSPCAGGTTRICFTAGTLRRKASPLTASKGLWEMW